MKSKQLYLTIALLLGVITTDAIRINHRAGGDPEEDKALAAIGAAINAETQDIAASEVADGEVTQIEDSTTAASAAPPPPALPEDDGPKPNAAESEVDNLMAKYDNEEKDIAYQKSDKFK